jgi:hypothetical protein
LNQAECSIDQGKDINTIPCHPSIPPLQYVHFELPSGKDALIFEEEIFHQVSQLEGLPPLEPHPNSIVPCCILHIQNLDKILSLKEDENDFKNSQLPTHSFDYV